MSSSGFLHDCTNRLRYAQFRHLVSVVSGCLSLGMSQFCEYLHCPACIGCVCNGERESSTVFPRYSALPPHAPRGFSGSLCYDDMPSVHAHKQCDKGALSVSHPCDARKFCIVRHGCAYGLAPIDPPCCSHRLFAVTHCAVRPSTGRMKEDESTGSASGRRPVERGRARRQRFQVHQRCFSERLSV